MKLVAKYQHLQQAEQAAMLLNAHGIITHVSSSGIKSLRHIIYSDISAELFVLIDEQHEDAIGLLSDSDHNVTSGLSEQALTELKSVAQSNVSNSLNKASLFGVAIIIVMILIIIGMGAA